MNVQPIIDLTTGRTVAAEALARFPRLPTASATDEVFAAAHAAGRGRDLEATCIRAARDLLDSLPSSLLLAINVSPDALDHGPVQDALRGDLSHIIIEITEQPSADPSGATQHLSELRRRGALLAVDDVSTGYAGLTRLAALSPDIIKLDRNLITNVRHNRPNIAVIEALVSLARRLGSLVLAEGVESVDDLTALPGLDIDYAQGWAIAPSSKHLSAVSTSAVQACRAAREDLLRVGARPDAGTSAIGRVAGMHHATAALARSRRRVEFDSALAHAANTLGLDRIGVTALANGPSGCSVSAGDIVLGPSRYLLGGRPTTASTLRAGTMVEMHTDQGDANDAERRLLHGHGVSSVLLVPLLDHQLPLGILEFSHRRPHRWTTRDLTHARGLADHVGTTLHRLATA